MEITPRLITGNEPVREIKVDERLDKRLIQFKDEEETN